MSKLLAASEGLVPVSQIFEVPFQNINLEQGLLNSKSHGRFTEKEGYKF